ncbi:MAG TPA: hypothetical protein VIG33_18495 [Pseudobdellovibrionaceae bacterium]|jgi:hypothetical protein
MADMADNIIVSNKILLVYEEYSEMIGAQGILQKVGFDVLGISNEYTLSENVLSFNPDLVVAFGRAGKVTTIGVGRRLREMTRWQGKVILVLPAGYKPNPQDFAKIRADMLLEAPLPALRLMQIIGKMLGHDEALLQERLAKHGTETSKLEGVGVAGTGADADRDDTLIVTGSAETVENFTVSGSATLNLNKEEKEKSKFGFDMASETSMPLKNEQNLEALWNELTENNELNITPEEDLAAKNRKGKKVSFDLEERNQEFSENELERLARSLQSAHNTEAERVSKYVKFTAKITDFDSRQSLNKIASRKVQKEIASHWNLKEIEDQDDLRRGFAKALFRKK